MYSGTMVNRPCNSEVFRSVQEILTFLSSIIIHGSVNGVDVCLTPPFPWMKEEIGFLLVQWWWAGVFLTASEF